jgi:hypothetical protein
LASHQSADTPSATVTHEAQAVGRVFLSQSLFGIRGKWFRDAAFREYNFVVMRETRDWRRLCKCVSEAKIVITVREAANDMADAVVHQAQAHPTIGCLGESLKRYLSMVDGIASQI